MKPWEAFVQEHWALVVGGGVILLIVLTAWLGPKPSPPTPAEAEYWRVHQEANCIQHSFGMANHSCNRWRDPKTGEETP